MTRRIVEVGEDGNIVIPVEWMGGAEPHAVLELDVVGNTVLVKEAGSLEEAANEEDAKARARKFEEWVSRASLRGPDLTLEQMSRETICD